MRSEFFGTQIGNLQFTIYNAPMIGRSLIIFSFVSIIISATAYFFALKKKSNEHLQLARISFHGSAISVILGSFLLLYFILTHQFQYSYVWNYSSTDLPLHLLLSTFYAGQEGSFMLWALYTTIIGIVLLGYSSKKGWEVEVMFVFNLVLGFLLLMLVVKNPFAYIWDTFPEDLIHTGALPQSEGNVVWLDEAQGIWAQFPTEGKGLNPLLQNYWMAIHPQILFSGFSSMSVPYIFAVAALLRKEYQTWIPVAKPWIVFGTGILGLGIILGGFWAYETLGWGGYWGWDPVENSSLVPWLIGLASVHTMMSQRKMGSFVRTNFVLSILCFVLVLYSTFLTRSGVLGDTSVHSFVDPGMWAYWILLSVLVSFALLGFGLLLVRNSAMPKIPVEHSFLSREFAIFLGATLLSFTALFILVGTSSPIITTILSGKTSAIDISYYAKTSLPFGIGIAFLMGFGQLLWWRNSQSSSLLKSLLAPMVFAFIFSVVLFFAGMNDALIILFIFFSAFALAVNVIVGYRIIKGSPKYSGGTVAHIGMALMFIGFVTSSRYDDKQTVSLEEGKTLSVLNHYQLTFLGYQPMEQEKYSFNIRVEKDGVAEIVSPVMYFSKFTNGLMRIPDILNQVTQDFYIAPVSLETPERTSKGEILTFKKGEMKKFDGMNVTFVDYDFSDEEKGKMVTQAREVQIGADFVVEKNGVKENIKPLFTMENGEVQYLPAKLSSGYVFTISKITPDKENTENSSVEISIAHSQGISETPKKDTLIIEASVKPYINLVWLGTIIMVLGFFVTVVRRLDEARKKE